MSTTWGKLDRFCMLCGRTEGEHSNVFSQCPNPRASELGQPFFLAQLFEPQFIKGRAEFKPTHFKQRAQ